MLRRILTIAAVLCAAGAALSAPLAREVLRGPAAVAATPAPTGIVVVKFHDDGGVTVHDGGRLEAASKDRGRLNDLLARVAPGARWERRFDRPVAELDAERADAAVKSGHALPRLSAYAEFDPGLSAGDLQGLRRIVRELMADPAVETAFLEPKAVPAALGFDAFTGTYTPQEFPEVAASPDKVTPDFTAQQGYLDNVQGVHALAVQGLPGADGAGVKVVDIEGAWLWDHEDLPAPFHESGGQYADQGWRDHGTAVLGEIRGSDNGYGVTGIAPACEVGAASIAGQSVPSALSTATAATSAGDVILIELHAPGPNANGSGQYGYVAMEYWQDNFDAIQVATAAGRIVVEAAGNGQQDYDDPVYGSLFDPAYRHSGAIMVGAGDATSDPEWFTNHGVRVDLNGWGSNVVTCGYGGLQGSAGGFPEEEWYTATFGGTSSASPIVVGAVVSVQGMVKDQLATVLDAGLMRDMLHDTGTPQLPDPWLIGPRPNIDAAWTTVQAGIGVVSGTVTALGSGLPIEGVLVQVQGSSRSTKTDATGAYTLGMPVGAVTLEFSEYYHEDATVGLTVTAGGTVNGDAVMTALPTVALQGKVVGTVPISVAGARVTPLDVPLTAAVAGGDGSFSIPGVPVGKTVELLVDGVPYFGADYLSVTPFDPGGGVYPVYPELRFTTQSFASAGGWTAVGPSWAWGTPTTGPSASWSPGGCWGVGMDANYNDAEGGSLQSPSLTFWTGDQLHLSFHTWSQLEDGWDGVNLRMRHDVDWELLTPMNGYSHLALPGLNNAPGWSGNSGGWVGSVVDMTAWIGQPFELSFLFGSDDYVNDVGFFLDDVTFDTGDTIVGVDDLPGPGLAVKAHPNPFNPSTTVSWSAPRDGQAVVTVHDARGRAVRRLFDGRANAGVNLVTWDGRDDAGRTLPTGTYLVRVRGADGGVATTRVTLLK